MNSQRLLASWCQLSIRTDFVRLLIVESNVSNCRSRYNVRRTRNRQTVERWSGGEAGSQEPEPEPVVVDRTPCLMRIYGQHKRLGRLSLCNRPEQTGPSQHVKLASWLLNCMSTSIHLPHHHSYSHQQQQPYWWCHGEVALWWNLALSVTSNCLIPYKNKYSIFSIFGLQHGWRGGLVVSALDQRPRGRGFAYAGCGLSRSNRGPVALCTMGLGLLNPPSFRGR